MMSTTQSSLISNFLAFTSNLVLTVFGEYNIFYPPDESANKLQNSKNLILNK